MSITEQAQELLGKIRTPEVPLNIHSIEDPSSSERRGPLPAVLPSRVDSIAAAFQKTSPLVNVLRQAAEPSVAYVPDSDWESRLTDEEREELFAGINPAEHFKIRGSLNGMQAQKNARDIRERDRLNAIQFANGTILGMASEVLAYLDPIAVSSGSGVLAAGAYIPKAFQASKAVQRLGGAAALGAFTGGEEKLSQWGREGSRDDHDVLYAAVAGMAAGGIFGPGAARVFEGEYGAFLKNIDTRTKELGTDIQKTLEDSLLRIDQDTRPLSTPDEAYNIRGGDIEVTPELRASMKDTTLTQNFTPEEVQIAVRADQLVAEGAVGKLPEKSWVTKMMQMNPFMTDGFRGLMSKSNAAKVLFTHIGEIATGSRGGVATSASMHKRIHETLYLRMVPILEDAQSAYLSARGVKQWDVMKYNGSGKRTFDEELVAELGNRNALRPANPHVDPHIKRAADAIDEATKRGLDDLKAAGWAGADEVKWKPGYFPLVWSRDKIQKMHTAGRGADVHALLKQAYTAVGMSPELAGRLTSAVINRRLANAADLDFNPAALFSKSSRGELERMLRDAKTSELDIRGIMKLTEGDAGGALKKRTEIDLNAQLGDMRISDLIQTDIGNLMSRWAQRTGGMVGLAKKGIRSFDDIDSYKKVIRSQAAGAGEDPILLGNSVDALFDQMLARPVNGGVDRNMRRMLDWSMVTKLGQLMFAQTAEANNLSAAHGIFQVLKSIPAAASMRSQLVKAAKSGDYSKIDKKWFAEMQVLGGNMIDEHLLYRPAVRLDETVSEGWASTFDNVMAMATDKLGYMSGMYQVKGIEQAMSVMLQTDKIVSALSGKITKSKLKRVGELGWSDEFILKLKGELDNNATFKGKVLDRLNLENWDTLTRTEFLSGMHRHVHQMVQQPLAGEGSFRLHSNIGAMVTQFRSFPLLAMEKQTGRHLLAGDAETGLAVMYGFAWATAAGLVRTYSNSIGRADRDEYILKRTTPEALAMNAMLYTSTFGVFGDLIGGLGATLGMTEGGARGSRLIPPALSGVTQLSSGVGNVLGAANPLSDTRLSERGMRNVMSAVPLGNTLPAAWITTGLATLVPEE